MVAEFSFFYTKRSSMTYSFKQFVQNFMFRFLGSRVSSRFQENGTYAIGLRVMNPGTLFQRFASVSTLITRLCT